MLKETAGRQASAAGLLSPSDLDKVDETRLGLPCV